jgi:hypothetical protein
LQPVEWLDHAQLESLFKTRQVVRYAYQHMAEVRDNSPYNPDLVNCTRLIFRALTILDNSLDDEQATIHTARGACDVVDAALVEVKKIRDGGVEV